MAGVVKLLTFAICVIRCESQGFDYWTEDWSYRLQIGLDWAIMIVRNGNPHHHQHVHNHHLHQHSHYHHPYDNHHHQNIIIAEVKGTSGLSCAEQASTSHPSHCQGLG